MVKGQFIGARLMEIAASTSTVKIIFPIRIDSCMGTSFLEMFI